MQRRRDSVGSQWRKQDEERYGQFWELSGQSEQRCFALFVLCVRNTEDSQKERAAVVKMRKNKGRDKRFETSVLRQAF